MFSNLFKTRTPKLYASDPSEPPVLSDTEIEGEKRLKDAQDRLAELLNSYERGDPLGNPDDMLEMIEDFESIISTLSDAKKRGWVPSKKVIKHLRTDLEKQRLYMIKSNYCQESINLEIAWRQERLDEAIRGLR